MKAIVIEESEFEREFQITLDKLKAEGFDCLLGKDENHELRKMLRKFHYEVCDLKDRLMRKK